MNKCEKMDTLGARIKVAVEGAGGVTALEKSKGIKRTTTYGWINDEREPRVSDLVKIAEFSGCSALWIIFGGDVQKTEQTEFASNAINEPELKKTTASELDVEAVKKIAGVISLFLAENKLQLPHAEFVNLTFTLYKMSDGKVDSEEVLMALKKIKS